ncbi:MAG: DNA polymerase III subunit alpha [Vigna little leaf phytoplasma]|nr:DNA polymerase III subunit alpha [Vigna little leaf phytoplasma]
MEGIFYLQSFYSIMDSVNSLEGLVKKAKEQNYDFVALSDYENLYGMIEFFHLCDKYQIKPIIGMKITLNLEEIDNNLLPIGILIYALNNQGVKNLIQISNILRTQKRSLHFSELKLYRNDLFCMLTSIDCLLYNNFHSDVIHKIIKKLKQTYQHFYLGLSLQSNELYIFSEIFLSWALQHKVQITPTHQTKYLEQNDSILYEIFTHFLNRKSILDKMKNDNLSFEFLTRKSKQDYYGFHYNKYFQDFLNLKQFIPQIQYSQNFGMKNFHLPIYSQNKFPSSFQYLYHKTHKALKDKNISYKNIDASVYLQRLEKELQIVKQMNYADYFLIVSDIVHYAKKQEILLGPGRGSSASSLICYCLGITEIDPLVYNLLFERFLNLKRQKLPDIDLDFPDDQIVKILKYIVDKYKADYVANIITFNTWSSKYFLKIIDELKELQKQKTASKLKQFLYNDKFHYKYELILQKIDSISRDEFDIVVQRIDGIPRFTGTHPAGIIISNHSLLTCLPIQNNPQTYLPFKYQTQFDAQNLEKIGLLKIDLLSLKSLTLVRKILKTIQKPISLVWDKIPLNDSETYQTLQKAKTDYIFQLETVSAKKVLIKIKPQNFEDLAAILALNRPGTKNYIDAYCINKQKKSTLNLSPKVDAILNNTYGIILYQEQIMEIAVHFAGYDLGESEILMKNLSKKKNEKHSLQKINKYFIDKSLKQGHSIILANRVYNYMLKFSDYSFNKSHSFAYALISYRMAYLKTHYFISFVTVLLNEFKKNSLETFKLLLQIKKEYNIHIKLPNLQLSDVDYKFISQCFILPFTIIPGISEEISIFIIKEREKKKFVDFFDFKIRCHSVLTNELLQKLIWLGVFDDWGLTKRYLIKKSKLEYLEHERYLTPSLILDSNLPSARKEDYSYLDISKKVEQILGFNLYQILFE